MGAGVLTILLLPFFQSHLYMPLSYFFAYALAKHWNVTLWLRWYDTTAGIAGTRWNHTSPRSDVRRLVMQNAVGQVRPKGAFAP
jgi:hypothetical protein